ncbi:peroxiredoxin [Candidatus Uhrbacteria bacterium]|nr:MAG: peroxiredoxin [Candidatus Uhrbacteria bacterium]
MKKTPGPGMKAPAFELEDASGMRIRLSEALVVGPVVLVFYPGDRTPGCTLQLCAIRDEWQAFSKFGITVFGINHADAESHRAFASAHRFPFPLLVDDGKRVSKQYGATRSILKRDLTRRIVVGISPDGIIRYYRHGFPKNAEILKALKPFAKV